MAAPVASSHRKHGTRARYVVDRCRCAPCTKANREAENHRYRMQAYGQWQPYVDASPVRAHVRALQECGLGWKRIAELADVSRGTVEKLLYGAPHRGMGPSKGVRPDTAAKLLAVTASGDKLGSAIAVDGTGSRRRLQALIAAGWPQAQLARRLSMKPGNFGKTLRSERVLTATARAVKALYDELWRADPAEHGVTAQAIARARNQARAEQWAPVGAWDEDTLDDPAAYPDWTGRCGTSAGFWLHRKALRTEPCDRCKKAHNAAQAERRTARMAAAKAPP
jgi:hypothetical protein